MRLEELLHGAVHFAQDASLWIALTLTRMDMLRIYMNTRAICDINRIYKLIYVINAYKNHNTVLSPRSGRCSTTSNTSTMPHFARFERRSQPLAIGSLDCHLTVHVLDLGAAFAGTVQLGLSA